MKSRAFPIQHLRLIPTSLQSGEKQYSFLPSGSQETRSRTDRIVSQGRRSLKKEKERKEERDMDGIWSMKIAQMPENMEKRNFASLQRTFAKEFCQFSITHLYLFHAFLPLSLSFPLSSSLSIPSLTRSREASFFVTP